MAALAHNEIVFWKRFELVHLNNSVLATPVLTNSVPVWQIQSLFDLVSKTIKFITTVSFKSALSIVLRLTVS